ncbi:hypothetical protein PENANT_c016G09617 [Penicillium antarcticum]|uniref:non-specific serine/threonine protein kinase n=1 Tax=Penicillium antarcticum TaxID=416450 RepID=A0A1V6Q2W0_9EURO|nr:hypothetical protein PENANT_c016G09617 [Penicillium antarcticum]
MDSRHSDLVLDAQIQVEFSADLTHRFTIQSKFSSGRHFRRRQRKDTWQVEKLLGSGSSGTVSLHKCLTSEGQAELQAVRMINKALLSKGIDYYKELEAIAKFSQKKYDGSFVKFLGWYESNDFVFIVMEYMKHGDLDSHLKKPLPENEAREITLQLAEGLEFLHDNRVAHRNLKPANIFVFRKSPDWWVKLGDFGFSKCVNENEGLQTWVGTPLFIAPEMQMLYPPGKNGHSDMSHYTEKVDIWALGVTTYYMVFHDYPFTPRKRVHLSQYVHGAALPLPKGSLSPVSQECYNFIKATIEPDATKRLSAKAATEDEWLKGLYVPVAGLKRLGLSETNLTNVASRKEVQTAPKSFHATPEQTIKIFQASSESNPKESVPDNAASHVYEALIATDTSAEHADTSNNEQSQVGYPNIARPKHGRSKFAKDLRLGRLGILQDYHTRGVQLFRQNKHAEAEILLRKAAMKRNQELGLANHDTRNSFHCLGVLYYHMSTYRVARWLFQQVLEVQKKKFGLVHPCTLKTEYWIGLTMLRDGMNREGRLTVKRVANIQKRVLGPNHPDTLLSLSELDLRQPPEFLGPSKTDSLPQMSLSARSSEMDLITKSMRKYIQDLKAELWPEHHNTDSKQCNRRITVRLPPTASQPIAKPQSEESLSSKIKTHYRTMAELGQWLHGKGYYKAAQNSLEMAVSGLNQCLGPTHAEFLDALYWLGLNQFELGQYENAENIFREVSVGRDTSVGWKSRRIFYFDFALALGRALAKQGNGFVMIGAPTNCLGPAA